MRGKKYKMVPAAPLTPVSAASPRGRPAGSRKSPVITAGPAAAASSAVPAATTGHRPLPGQPGPAR